MGLVRAIWVAGTRVSSRWRSPRRMLGVCAVWCVALASLPVAQASLNSTMTETTSSVYSYASTVGGTLVVDGSVSAPDGAGSLTLATVFADKAGRPSAVFAPQIVDINPASGGLTVTTPEGTWNSCQMPLTCHVTDSGGTIDFGFTWKVAKSTSSKRIWFYVVQHGSKVSLRDDALVKWRARHRMGGAYFVSTRGGDSVGLVSDAVDAGIDIAYSAPGFRSGSIALTIPECSDVGAGLWSLVSRTSRSSSLCPVYALGSVSRSDSGWRATGPAAGVSEQATRLEVVAL